MDMFLQKHIYLRLRKKTGRPLGLFSELQISHNLQTSYEITLDKTQPFSVLLFYPF